MRNRSIRFFTFLLLTSGLLACGGATDPDQAESGEKIPAKAVSGETVQSDLPFPVYENFSELEPIFKYQNDTTYVINFWATWCKPCVEELPYFEQLHREFSDQKVKVILVSLDFANDVETKLLKFVETKKLQPQVIALTDGKYNDWIDKVHPEWSGAIPVTYIYKGNKVLFHDQQYENYDELITSLKSISLKG